MEATLLRDAWAAGIVDGEGSISINKKGLLKGRQYYSLVVSVGQSGQEISPILHQLKADYGGTIYRLKYSKPQPLMRQPHWAWQVTTACAERFLMRILPYLVGKKARTELALEYRETVLRKKKIELAVEYYQRLKEMNSPCDVLRSA